MNEHENEDNSVLQAFSIIGRYNGQYWSVNADQGNADGFNGWTFISGIRVYFWQSQYIMHPFMTPDCATAELLTEQKL